MSYRNARALDKLVAELRAGRPGITIGTLRLPVDPDSDHTPWLNGCVRAADVMTTDGDRLAENVAAKLNRHPAMGSGSYVIWRQRIKSADREAEGWRMMEDRGSVTANHYDHVHISLTTNPAGYDYTGSWGALWSGTGTGAAPTPTSSSTVTPGGPGTLDLSPTGTADTSASSAAQFSSGGVYGSASFGLDDVLPGDLEDTIAKAVVMGGALVLGVALVGLGASRATRPARQQVAGDVVQLIPQTRAAGAAGAVTRGA